MDYSKRRIQKIVLVSILTIAIILSGIGIISEISQKAGTIQVENMASQATDLGEILLKDYESDPSGKVFEGKVFWDLISRISGGAVTNKSQLDSWSIAAGQEKTSADFRSYNSKLGNGAKDIVVTIGGKQWIATYLSQSTNGPILTFWLASSTKTARWNENATNEDGNFPSSMYGTSEIRAVELNNGGGYAVNINDTSLKSVTQNKSSDWAIYTMTKSQGVNGSLAQFIEVPNNVTWQHTQYAKDKVTYQQSSWNHNNNNDALDVGNDAKQTGSFLNKTGYKNWATDRIWLPSIAEVGLAGVEGLWKASNDTRLSNGTAWLRSGNFDFYSRAATLLPIDDNGSYGSYATVDTKLIVRPAFHLNLKAVGGCLGVEPPKNVETVYNGNKQTLDNIAKEQKGWYNSEFMTLSYLNDNMKDSGTYTVKVTINATAQSKGITFNGNGNSYERTFEFKINKKPIVCELALSQWGVGYTVKPKAGEANKIYDSDMGSRAPTFKITYTAGGATYSEFPTVKGTYTVTAAMNENKNYTLKESCTTTLTIAAAPAKPSISTSSLTYNSSLQEFTISGLSTDVKIDNIKDASNKVLEYKDGVFELKENKLKVKNVGTYYVTFSLANINTMVWASGGTDSFTLPVTINPQQLPFNLSCDANSNTWVYGEQPTVTVTENSYPNDTVELKLYYINNSIGTGTKYDEINTIKVVNGKTTTITMPGTIAKGDYTIYVELATASSSNSNGNYSLTPKTLVFHVNGKAVTLQDSDIDWLCDSISIGDPTNYSLVYTGRTYTFSIDDSVLASRGVKIDTSQSDKTGGYSGNISEKDARASLYSVTVYLTNLDDTYVTYSKSYTLYYRIDKAKYDLSGLSWPAVNEFEYNASPQSVTLEGSFPFGLTAKYTGDISKTLVGKYRTGVNFSVADTTNYVTPKDGDENTYEGGFVFSFDWEIIKATISVSWKDDNNGNVTKYTWPTLNNLPQTDTDTVKYTYYKGSEQVTELPDPKDVTEETTYKVVATLDDAYKDYYVLSTGDKAEYSFVIGKDKFVVKLELQWDGENIQGKQLVYTGRAYTPSIKMIAAGNGSVSAKDITLKYYKDEAVSSIAEPIEVGTYRIEVVLNSDKAEDNYIGRDCLKFKFEITKAKVDTSQIVWGYTTDGENWIAFGNNYDLQYSRADGKAVSYTVGLINVPEILKDSITYSEGYTQSGVGNYNTQYSVGDLGSNYEQVVMPKDLSEQLDWSIITRLLPLPKFDGSWKTFDGKVHDFAQMYGLKDGWENYISISVTRNGQPVDGYTAIKAGDYSVKFDLIDYNGTDWEGTVRSSYPIIVSPYVIESKWQGSNVSATLVLDNWVRSYIDYRFTDVDGNALTNGFVDMVEGVAYHRVAYVKEGNEYGIDDNDIMITGEPKTVYRGTVEIKKPVFDTTNVITYDGAKHSIEEFLVGTAPEGVKFEINGDLIDAREYKVTVSLDDDSFCWNDEIGSMDSYIVTVKIEKAAITPNRLSWTIDDDGLPKLTVRGNSEIEFAYTYYDKENYEITLAEIAEGAEVAKVVARLNNGNYKMVDASNNTVEKVEYAIGEDGKWPSNGGHDDKNKGLFGVPLDEIPLWQLIVSAVSIILIISFLAKIGSCESKRKKAKKKIEKYSSSVYVAGGMFWNLSVDNWTIIAISLAAGAVICLVGMIIAILRLKSVENQLEEIKEEHEKDMIISRNGGYGVQQGVGVDEIRGTVLETVSALLPGMQQALPQQASNNDDVIQRLVENQELLMQKMSETQSEKIIEREVVATNDNDETIKKMMGNQEKLMEKILELSANQPQPQVQVIEKEVPVEKVVEKVVEVPVEVEKIVEVPVEKIVEKVVEKEVKVHVAAPAKPKKETAPRLTLDEAYKLLSKEQKNYFDGLKQYALSKPGTKEKKATYSLTIGQSTVNPLLKLTIKKDTTVALFKMEDEYLKDIKRDASGDGTKIKVKETEVIISDAQACKAAKNMIDLREDQIERYQDLLKEQRAMKK